jgi:hypothetical protein
MRVVGGTRNFGGEFEASDDGQRFLFIRNGQRVAASNLNVVLHWTEALKRLMPSR